MSYARWSAGDVYVYHDVHGGFTCCACTLKEKNRAAPVTALFASVNVATRKEMLANLREHVAIGHEVPPWAIARLEAEIAAEVPDDVVTV